jgi:hypothetical protein
LVLQSITLFDDCSIKIYINKHTHLNVWYDSDLGGAIPALYGLLGILIIPWIWSLPIALIVAELGSAMPDSGGFLYWVKIGNRYSRIFPKLNR